ncbi:hypothetical protein FRB93_001565 [Tulasnella sp. JGI-2019a]|nr:hypothetical protein FRB93_001565 [Tulasnella sp. JGI-2019a]
MVRPTISILLSLALCLPVTLGAAANTTTTSSTATSKLTSSVVAATTSTTTTKIVATTTTDKPTTTAVPTNSAAPNTTILDGPRTTNLLADIPGLYPLPDPSEVIKNATLNTTDIQGDILVGMKKKLEMFYFFQINNVTSFKAKVHHIIVPEITSVFQLLDTTTQPIVCLNLAFSQTGLQTLGFNTNLGDPVFGAGQAADAVNLGDPGTTNWVKTFTNTKALHGVFLMATDDQAFLDVQIQQLEYVFGTDITHLYSLEGNIRPPPYEGHEMFGYLDGIGQPAVAGFNLSPFPGQLTVSPGVILAGEPGDIRISTRPSWAKDGSFLAFRQLKQLVPEFDNFLLQVAPPISGMTTQESADLVGARMIGRWKSGAPTDLNPTADNPSQGIDPNQNNDFDYSHAGFNLATDESHCPFAAHIRKTRPRADLNAPDNTIMRAGIPYGPEVTDAETQSGTSNSTLERGLAFVAYQSSLEDGFQFMQKVWANDPTFAPSHTPQPGWDPIIGQAGTSARFMNGYNIQDTTQNLVLKQEYVISRGGEYFFSPSISAIHDVLSV